MNLTLKWQGGHKPELHVTKPKHEVIDLDEKSAEDLDRLLEEKGFKRSVARDMMHEEL